jgi:hypothetical protein
LQSERQSAKPRKELAREELTVEQWESLRYSSKPELTNDQKGRVLGK